jgi:Uri superfamily endonuclease
MKGLQELRISEKEGNSRKGGAYTLLIRVDSECEIQIGKLGGFVFKPGLYIYTGSAINNINARIKRHKSENKKIRWHIDYLLKEKDVHLIAYNKYYFHKECNVNKRIKEIKCAKVLIKGFGSSDCKDGCESHLIYFNRCCYRYLIRNFPYK